VVGGKVVHGAGEFGPTRPAAAAAMPDWSPVRTFGGYQDRRALVVAATIAVQFGGSVLLILGRLGWLTAGALGVFTALATLIAHPYWTVEDPAERFHALNTFLEHIGLIGGFMLAAVLVEREQRAA
jgi:uncharacterized membrane protein YphA (DoxX/SURF4 family)